MNKVKKLKIYQKSVLLVIKIYELTRSNYNLSKDYSLKDQIRRAAISIVTNIAEGAFRTKKQFINYLRISSGSTNEVITLLEIINKVYQINTKDLEDDYIYLGKQINSFSKKLK